MAAARPREKSPLFSILRVEAVHLSVTVRQMNRLGCRSAPCPGRGSVTLALLMGVVLSVDVETWSNENRELNAHYYGLQSQHEWNAIPLIFSSFIYSS